MSPALGAAIAAIMTLIWLWAARRVWTARRSWALAALFAFFAIGTAWELARNLNQIVGV